MRRGADAPRVAPSTAPIPWRPAARGRAVRRPARPRRGRCGYQPVGFLALVVAHQQSARATADIDHVRCPLVEDQVEKLTPEIITAAILGFEHQKRQIDTKIAELRAMLPGGSTEPATTPDAPTGKRRKFSAAARRRMREAQQRRWASIRGESEPSAPATPKALKPKRKLSAAGRKAIQEALRRRWAQKSAEAAKAQPASAKKTARKKAATKKAATGLRT